MAEEKWRILSQQNANRGRVVAAFLAYYMAQAEIATQRELAERLSVNEATISWWKSQNAHRRTVPEYQTLANLCTVLGCSIDDALEAFGVRPPSDADASTQELLAIYARLSPSDQALIRELAWSRLQRQSQPTRYNQRVPA